MSDFKTKGPYNPAEVEKEIYAFWEKGGFFTPKIDKKKKPYIIMIPPPNITGSLHMGHALNNTIQDILTRYHRMLGEPTLWLPGTDHAGIATQNVVEKELKKEGKTRTDLGREKFIKRVWEWKEKYGNIIIEQLKKLGASCDWTRLRFTMDEGYTKAINVAFINYFKKGYIYRGKRIVNWCSRCGTAISDIEIKYQDEKTKLWYLKYQLKKSASRLQFTLSLSKGSKNKDYIIVATTRPETMLGDTAVAVNPKDSRYKNLIGKKVILPIVGREIPIVPSPLIDKEFGTGALKVTPAHDQTDWEIAEKNGLEIINVIGENGKMTARAGKEFKGMTIKEARKKVLKILEDQKLIEKIEVLDHKIFLCDRCGTIIEPLVSLQWFIKMDKLTPPAIKVVQEEKVRFIPTRYKKVYLNWMENIKDWCISRQLWWGHQIPIWYCGNPVPEPQRVVQGENPAPEPEERKKRNGCGAIISAEIEKKNGKVEIIEPEKCPKCGSKNLKQDSDVLDTWFSSALWPFATLGWPDETPDLKYFYPTSFLSTAQEIIYLWVARMIFSGLEFMEKPPFEDVYIHATVLNIEGRRMSKSLGTGVDPLLLIEKYGADATRLGIIYQTSRDSQAIRFSEEALLGARNFVNKLWNLGRFVSMKEVNKKTAPSLLMKKLSIPDKWILSRANRLVEETASNLDTYHLGRATRSLYDFVWHNFADFYVEIAKIENTKESRLILWVCYTTLLKLLHPFLPFATEKIGKELGFKTPLITSPWPSQEKNLINKKAEKEFETIRDIIIKIRNQKAEKEKIPPEIMVKKNKRIIRKYEKLIQKLTKSKIKKYLK